MERVVELEATIREILGNQSNKKLLQHKKKDGKQIDLRLTPQDWDVLKEFARVCDPLLLFLNDLQDSKEPTISRLVPDLEYMKLVMNDVKDLTYVTKFRDRLVSNVSVRFEHVLTQWSQHRLLCLMALLLDPRAYPVTTMPSAEEQETGWDLIKRLAASLKEPSKPKESLRPKEEAVQEVKQEVPVKVQIKKRSFIDLQKEQEVAQPAEVQLENAKKKLRDEIDKFKVISRIDRSNSLLDWWRLNEGTYPILSRVARALLCIPVADAEVERVFSAAGLIVTKRRNRLKSDTISKLLFVKRNMHN